MKNYIVMKEVKAKSIIVDGDLHNRFKILCKGKSMKIGGVVENLMKLYLEDPKTVQKMIDESKEKKIKVI
jgi:hypothetical protein